MRKAAEARDNRFVSPGEFEIFRIAERREQFERAPLHGQVFRMLEGDVDEAPFLRRQLHVQALGDGALRQGERLRVRSEGLGRAAEHVAGKLIEHKYGGKHAFRVVEPTGRDAILQRLIGLAKPRRDLRIDMRRRAVPFLRRQLLEPEADDLFRLGDHQDDPSAEAAIAASMSFLASGEAQSAGPTSRPISSPCGLSRSVVGMPTTFSVAKSLPEGSA